MSGDNFSVSFFDDVEGDAKKELLEVEERLNRRKFRGASTGDDQSIVEPEEGESACDESDGDDKHEDGALDDDLEFHIVDADGEDGKEGDLVIRRRQRNRGVQKPITQDLDSDDELLVHMKTIGFSDHQIVERFLKEGRAHYTKKAVSARFRRIMMAQEDAIDEALKDELIFWTATQDEALVKSYAKAIDKVQSEVEKVHAKQWHFMHSFLREVMPDTRFSVDACRQRFADLVMGRATIPAEIDDDPEQKEYEQRTRAEQKIAAKHAEMERQQKLEEGKAAAAYAAKLEKEQRQQEMEDRKAERLRQQALVARNRAAEKMASLVAMSKRKKATQATSSSAAGGNQPTPPTSNTSIAPGIEDPRAGLTMPQLRQLCGKRHIAAKGASKAQLVERLRNYDAKYSNKQLQGRLRDLNRASHGTKDALLYRLADVDFCFYNDVIGEFDHDDDDDDVAVKEDEDADDLAQMSEILKGMKKE